MIRTRVSSGYIWFLVLANFGAFMAVVAPGAISLSLRVQEIAPRNVEVLGYIVGAGATGAAVSQPLVGMWSDRTRSRLGRRRPFSIGGAVLGFVALAFLAWAPSIPLLLIGWMIGMLGAKQPQHRLRERPTLTKILANMVFNPAEHLDFAWNWLGRLIFNLGVTFATTFTTLFFASRLSPTGQIADLGVLIPLIAIVSVVATAGGAFAGGFLSDKLRRRRVFVLLSGFAFTAGTVTMCFGGASRPILLAGSVIANLGLGVFSAVDQAIALADRN